MSDKDLYERLVRQEIEDDETSSFAEFLRDEGLEVLAAYRAVTNPRLRRSIRELIAMIASEERSHESGGTETGM